MWWIWKRRALSFSTSIDNCSRVLLGTKGGLLFISAPLSQSLYRAGGKWPESRFFVSKCGQAFVPPCFVVVLLLFAWPDYELCAAALKHTRSTYRSSAEMMKDEWCSVLYALSFFSLLPLSLSLLLFPLSSLSSLCYERGK